MRLLAAALVGLGIAATAAYAEDVLMEGSGIQNGPSLGESLSAVRRDWGDPDRTVNRRSLLGEYRYHEYHSRGVVLTTSQSADIIIGITFFCTRESSAQSLWKLPENMGTFRGSTSRGLRLESPARLEAIFSVYGRPDLVVSADSEALASASAAGRPFIIDKGEGRLSVVYPSLNMSFSTTNGVLQTILIRNFSS